MSPGPAADAEERPRRARWASILGFAVGLALLAAAIFVVGSRWQSLSGQWAASAPQGPWIPRWPLVAAAILLPAANWLCTSAAFWVITRRYGRVGFGEMSALIAASSLLNYLPLRPGLLGRVAYHRAVNGIPVLASMKVLLAVIACSGLAAVVLLGATAAAGPSAPGATACLAVIAPGVVLAGAWAMAWSKDQTWACYSAAAFFRYVDTLVWAGRYAAAFALWGSPISLGSAAVFAAVSQAVTLIPLAGNGLGLREWGTGYTNAWLASAGVVGPAGAAARDVGLAADLVNRACELVTLVPIGLIGWLWVARRLAQRHSGGRGPEVDNHTRTEHPSPSP